MPFIALCCLITVARTSSIMLNKSGENGLIPDLKVKALSFSPLSVILGVGYLYKAFIMLRYIPCRPTLQRVFFFLNHEWML